MHRILHYEIAEQLGEGKNGLSWSAVDSALQRAVVIKELRSPVVRREEWRTRFLSLMDLLNRLENTRIGRFYALEQSDGRWFLARQYVDGQSVADMTRAAPVEYPRWLTLALEMARTLKSIHDAGLVHGNVTSSNVLIDPQGEPILVDAGLGLAEPGPSNEEQRAYLAPELLRGEATTPSSDLYALGVVLFHLLTGRPPRSSAPLIFEEYSEQQVPGVARLLLGRLVATAPGERFGSADELIVTIQAVMSLGAEPVSTPESKKWSPTPRQYIMISVLVLLLIILWLVITSNPR